MIAGGKLNVTTASHVSSVSAQRPAAPLTLPTHGVGSSLSRPHTMRTEPPSPRGDIIRLSCRAQQHPSRRRLRTSFKSSRQTTAKCRCKAPARPRRAIHPSPLQLTGKATTLGPRAASPSSSVCKNVSTMPSASPNRAGAYSPLATPH